MKKLDAMGYVWQVVVAVFVIVFVVFDVIVVDAMEDQQQQLL